MEKVYVWLCKPVSHIWALITLESTSMLLVANSTATVVCDLRLNSLCVKRNRRLDLPTPESPISTTRGGVGGGGGGEGVEREGGEREEGERKQRMGKRVRRTKWATVSTFLPHHCDDSHIPLCKLL